MLISVEVLEKWHRNGYGRTSKKKEDKVIDSERVSVHNKYLLTVSEASEYFNIGEKKLRQLVQENGTADFVLNNGVKVLFKRVKFEQFIDGVYSI